MRAALPEGGVCGSVAGGDPCLWGSSRLWALGSSLGLRPQPALSHLGLAAYTPTLHLHDWNRYRAQGTITSVSSGGKIAMGSTWVGGGEQSQGPAKHLVAFILLGNIPPHSPPHHSSELNPGAGRGAVLLRLG